MKYLITSITIIIFTIITFNLTFAQYTESFENNFHPIGWSGKGWEKQNSLKRSGNFAARSSHNNSNNEDNYLRIDNVGLTVGNTISFYYSAETGQKNLNLMVYIKNDNVNNGDSILIASFNPKKKEWKLANIDFPAAYNNTQNNKLYFIVDRTTSDGADKVVMDDVNSNAPLPVEMQSFTYNVNANNVDLNWKTTMEINNMGFDVERNSGNGWMKIGFVSADPSKSYCFPDKNLQTGTYQYRLKQIDYNGNFEYHNLNSLVLIGSPKKNSLSQNYPNPFNPSTKISFELAAAEIVSLKIYDMSGREVTKLINNQLSAGYHTVEFKNNLASGVYYYTLVAGNFRETKRMTVIR